MRLYSAEVELRAPGCADAVAARLTEILAGYQISVSSLDDDWISARLLLVGSSLAQASQTATEVVGRIAGLEPEGCHVMSEAEFERRRRSLRATHQERAAPGVSA